ncbi:MAG: FecR domain-containing protein [Rhodospirillales bacterium]|nr:FecR domain-containing protein [Rhodospirillales bacterium]
MGLLTRIATGVLAVLLAAGGAHAQTAPSVGVAAAVVPDARSLPPGGEVRTLAVGANLVFRERVTTGPAGQVQLLFADQSAVSVGPGSDLTIDEYVYDPAAGAGRMAMRLARGAARFVGGKISKTGEVAIETPAGQIGIRGGMAMVDVAPDGATTRVVHLFGYTTLRALDGQTLTMSRTGTLVDLARPAQAGAPAPRLVARPAQSGEMAAMKGQFERRGAGTPAGAATPGGPPGLPAAGGAPIGGQIDAAFGRSGMAQVNAGAPTRLATVAPQGSVQGGPASDAAGGRPPQAKGKAPVKLPALGPKGPGMGRPMRPPPKFIKPPQ